ncbi:glycosyltransferase family 1 protein [Baudoinia panamericana UAMH 10762]|uniref:Sterol 3-beta-glucosyltransferase n=1 Tax=Baudoinia panamericana (strain UAMH 10762) TaxID=717646 RepID=M2MWK6_BAUPA|nr:glycosyltransferase family 1 protein [Baudoinia panamericana UAMH 10762]EMC95928.1 glycosyltransferase family 1 protein [Baudoinia panamericana UAMH 10762]
MSQSQFLPPRETVVEPPERPTSADGVRSDAPMLDRKLQAKARAEMDASTTSSSSRKGGKGAPAQVAPNKPELANALADIFQFDEPEEVIGEFACWYLQSVLLQGYMYITRKHVCFYAYLQKKGHIVIKSGHLAKQGKRNPHYRRYWLVLKGDVLSYYESAADPYFPRGTIDLRSAVSAELTPEKGKATKETNVFAITTEQRTYHFKADSITSAKEWVKQLQRVIFRSRNDGDSVKISLPLANVVEVESSPVTDLAETVRIRVIDDGTTFAVDEYFFTFFSRGSQALDVLRTLTEDNEARRRASRHGRALGPEQSPRDSDRSPGVPQPVRSTLSPVSAVAGRLSPRASGEYRRSSGETSRASIDQGRASFDRGRRTSVQQGRRSSKSPVSPSAHNSADSFKTSSEHVSSAPSTPGGVNDMSASQMLTGDGAFRAPTLRQPLPKSTLSVTTVERLRREPQQLSAAPMQTAPGTTRRQPPSRTLAGEIMAVTDPPRPMHTILATPLQFAYGLAEQVRDQSRRGLSYLGSSPKDYYNRFSGALAGGKLEYGDDDGRAAEDRIRDSEANLDEANAEKRFREHFKLPESERLLTAYYCSLHRVLPLYGKIYVGTRHFCFRSLLYGTRTRLVIPFSNLLNLEKEKGYRLGYPGMVVVIRGHEELFFDFQNVELRDDCVVNVLQRLDTARQLQDSLLLTEAEKMDAAAAAAEHEVLQRARKDGFANENFVLPQDLQNVDLSDIPDAPILFDDASMSILDFKPKKPMRITCLTIGSRGDVQPYIALCKGFMADGHHMRIATHSKFKAWIEKHGIEFAPVAGDPVELMELCTEHGMFTPSFVFESLGKMRPWLDELLKTAFTACKGSDLLIESPQAMAGIHIAEALGIPYFRAFTMPWTRTRAYPHAFAVPSRKLGGQYNYLTYTLFDNVFWQMSAAPINKWRGKTLGLKPTTLDKLQQNKVPFLYNYSPHVVPPPLDYSDWVRPTGFWFLDEGANWRPPDDLMRFITKARADGKKIVYIGFGSVPINESKQLLQQVVNAVIKADVRCILSKGWADQGSKKDKTTALPIPLPDSVFEIVAAPHDWLFKQIDAAVHHGGSGTTGASLRAGLPTIIKPWFGDQFFFATRVEDLGVGFYLRKTTSNELGIALWYATHDERIIKKAKVLGEQIRSEDGVGTAIKAIYRDMEYARTLIKKRAVNIKATDVDDAEDEEEESWTFVENESDVDIASLRLGDSAATGSTAHQQWNRALQYGRHLSLGATALKGRLT